VRLGENVILNLTSESLGFLDVCKQLMRCSIITQNQIFDHVLYYFKVTNLEGARSIIQYLLTTLCVFIMFHVSQDFYLCVTQWFHILDLCLILFHQ